MIIDHLLDFTKRIYSSLEEAFEFCWSSLANKHETLPKLTRRNTNRTNLHFKPQVYQINYVNIELGHQYGIPVTETQTFPLAKRPERRGKKRNSCFRRLACPVCLSVYLPVSFSDYGQGLTQSIRSPGCLIPRCDLLHTFFGFFPFRGA